MRAIPTSALSYFDGRLSEGAPARDAIMEVRERYGIELSAAKALALASIAFNEAFSFEGFSKRSAYGGRNWLKRQYCLTAEEAERVACGFEQGNRSALSAVLSFSDIADRRLTEHGKSALRELGVVR